MKPIDLVRLAELYANHLGLSTGTVATYAQRDGKFFGRLKDGGDCTLRVASRITVWFSDHWPDDLMWPADIPRPTKSTKTEAA